MSGLNLLNIDLNLLVAFDALVMEGHVSRAASRIGVSQPAMSRSLKQLRELFGDPLFRRTNDGMLPTPHALELARLLRPGLATISAAIGKRSEFDPRQVHRRFQLAMADMASFLALPKIMQLLQEESPYSDVAVIHAGNRDVLAKVEAGHVEFGFGIFEYLSPTLRSQNLTALREVCIADPGNPGIQDGCLDLDAFLTLPHVAVSMQGDHGTPVDVVLETLGKKRRVALTLPYFSPIPRLVLGTSMIAVVVEEMLNLVPEGKLLARYDVPLPLEPVMGRLVWHRRFDDDPGHRWFREAIMECLAIDLTPNDDLAGAASPIPRNVSADCLLKA